MAARMMALILVGLWAGPAAAEVLPDPTALPVRAASGGEEIRPANVLTAIKLSRKQKIAVIDGQEVALGGHYQDARVTRISENEVVLRRGREVTVLKLYPEIEKSVRSK
ncbi:MAG: MSHA biogenesis protein MshK [Thiobacillus sp.]|nr:MSHA biogenesis protein MshK [Thiobacillus sp.]